MGSQKATQGFALMARRRRAWAVWRLMFSSSKRDEGKRVGSVTTGFAQAEGTRRRAVPISRCSARQ